MLIFELLKEEFGCSGPDKSAATALASIAFDPINQIAYDCQIDRYGTSERALAVKHMARLEDLGLGGSILLMDRGYPSVALLASMIKAGFSYRHFPPYADIPFIPMFLSMYIKSTVLTAPLQQCH